MPRLCIDPGHGGGDPGAIGGGVVKESDINLAVCKKLQPLLLADGHDVLMTRLTDTTISLADIVKTSNDFRADLFLSVHCNAAMSPSAQGIETYFYKTGMKWARAIHDGMIQEFIGHLDRGLKTAGFYVLVKTKCPAALVELEFISNETQLNFLIKNENQERIAQCLADSIKGFINDNPRLFSQAG